MIIDVSSILKETGGRIQLDELIPFSDTDFLGESFSFDAPLKVVGSIVNDGKALELRAEACGNMQTNCARCRKSITVPVSFEMDEFFVREDENYDPDSDVYVFSGYKIDLSDVLYNCFIMNADSRYLCSEECKGLCPVCGADLNVGECSCGEDNIDPRWEKLKNIMENTDN